MTDGFERSVDRWLGAPLDVDADVRMLTASIGEIPDRGRRMNMRAAFRGLVGVGAVLILLAMIVVWRGSDQFESHVATTVDPHMTPAQAAEVVRRMLETERDAFAPALRTPIDILSVDALPGGVAWARLGVATDDAAPPVIWLVAARGPFVSTLGPPGLPPTTSDRGVVAIDDSTSAILSVMLGAQ